jgi:hypothetical protein
MSRKIFILNELSSKIFILKGLGWMFEAGSGEFGSISGSDESDSQSPRYSLLTERFERSTMPAMRRRQSDLRFYDVSFSS